MDVFFGVFFTAGYGFLAYLLISISWMSPGMRATFLAICALLYGLALAMVILNFRNRHAAARVPHNAHGKPERPVFVERWVIAGRLGFQSLPYWHV